MEKELVLRLKSGDEAAFEQIYDLYSPRLLGKLLKLVKSDMLAAELLQEVFIKLWQVRSELDPDKSFRSYLFCIAESRVCDFFRKVARDSRMKEELLNASADAYQHVEEALVHKEKSFLLHEAIEALPVQRRRIFQMVKVEGRSYDEVAQLLTISPSTISDHIVKATKAIRARLQSSQVTTLLILISALLR